jgi:gamma-glutamylcyclotransferase (GGCT)/AIG2-like uncharacterized protein YtfP
MAYPCFLFVYGTLAVAQNPFARRLVAEGFYLGEGKMRGKLYDAGDYPGAVYHAESSSEVKGYIFSVPAAPSFWSMLDDYEGVGQDEEFILTVVPVDRNGSRYLCAVYLYKRSVARLREIVSGDYLAFKGIGKPLRSI